MNGMNKYRLLKPILIVVMLLASAHVVSANDADGDGAVSSGDWWAFWIWEDSHGLAPEDQFYLGDHVLFFDVVAEEYV